MMTEGIATPSMIASFFIVCGYKIGIIGLTMIVLLISLATGLLRLIFLTKIKVTPPISVVFAI